MTTIIGISGSLRQASFNTRLLEAARQAMPSGASLEAASIRDIPLYDGDVEARDGIPAAVAALKERIAAADGLLLVTPEYNNSMPGVLKNAVDWLTRPASDIARVFGKRPVAVIGATPGRGATALGQAAWLPVLRTLDTLPYFGARIQVAQAAAAFDADGNLTDARIKGELEKAMRGFVSFIEASAALRAQAR
jgi:chromate reductase